MTPPGTAPPLPTEPHRPEEKRLPAKIFTSAVLIAALIGVRYAIDRGADEVVGPGGLLEGTIVEDDFSDRDGRWETADDSGVLLTYEDGAYRIVDRDGRGTLSTRFLQTRSVGAIAVEGDVIGNGDEPSGLIGVACVVETEPKIRAFVFGIEPAVRQFMVVRWVEDRRPDVIAVGRDLDPPPVIGVETPQVRGECGVRGGGTDLAMYVNDRLVVTGRAGTEPGFSGIGLAVGSWSAGTDARFDNVLAARIDVDEMPAPDSAGVIIPAVDERPPQGRIVISDDFADRSTGWFVERGEGYRLGYGAGVYRIGIDRPHEHRFAYHWLDGKITAQTVAAFAIADDPTLGGWLGPMCVAAHDPADAYVFAIDPALSSYSLIRIDDNGREGSLGFGLSEAILGTPFNAVRGDCTMRADGRIELTMYVNGIEVASVVDPNSFDRLIGVGLYGESKSAAFEARFDDIMMLAR